MKRTCPIAPLLPMSGTSIKRRVLTGVASVSKVRAGPEPTGNALKAFG